ncbi:hypothetical protein ACGFI4_02580 [Micromonospora carbonacea]|uniref:hypothetical protein n=1 Tax=Micromonospora carbonacea TaxID=47853 RepID=UPI00182ED1E0|nr:hypothetical protein [Micromonospora carbonacea]MBB5824124.1 hypothetical protein [Micromonospora carbonacea]
MEQRPRRRLRSATVQIGALTALALTVSGCNMSSGDDDDDDCALGPVGGGTTVALAMHVPATGTAATDAGRGDSRAGAAAAVPDRGGFGTHLASCGG